MNQINAGRKNKQISYTALYDEFEILINEILDLKKIIRPLRKKKYYSYREAAEILNISIEGLKTRIKRGQIQRISNSGKPMLSALEIERFLKSQNPEFMENERGIY